MLSLSLVKIANVGMVLWASKQYKKLIECERFRGYEGELPIEIYI